MGTYYSNPNEYLPIAIARELLCGYYNQRRNCINGDVVVDHATGHQVCSECTRPLSRSALRLCEICDRQFVDLTKYHDPKDEINCPRCVINYEL